MTERSPISDTIHMAPTTISERAKAYYTERAQRYGRTLNDFSEYLDGEPRRLTEEGEYIAVQRPAPHVVDTVCDSLRIVTHDIINGTDIKEALPPEWHHLPTKPNKSYSPKQSVGFTNAELEIEKHIKRLPDRLLNGAKLGRIEDITLQAVCPSDTNIAKVRRLLNKDATLYTHVIRAGENDLETYLLLRAHLYVGNSLTKNRSPLGTVSCLGILTRGVWGAIGQQVIAPRLYIMNNPINKQLTDSRFQQAAAIRLVAKADGIREREVRNIGAPYKL